MTFPILKALAAWLIIIVLESINGTIRRLWLIPAIGESRASFIGFIVGAIVILGVAVALSRWLGITDRTHLLMTGMLWAALTLSFEIVLGRWVFDFDWARIFAEYDITRGGVMSIGMVILVLAPSIAHRLRTPRR